MQLSSDDKEKCAIFEKMMAAYVKELDEHGHDPMPEGFLQKWIKSIISMQGPSDRHLELCYDGETLIGFFYEKIDHEDHKGFIKPGYGYIMEFYVKPEYRRRGYGRAMYRWLEWHPTKNLPLSAHDLTLKSTKKVWWKCQRGHEWQMDIRTRVSGIGNCPYCMGKRVCPENALATLSPEIAAQWHPTKNGSLTPEQVTNHSSVKAWWRCPKGHEWEAVIRSRTVSGAGCPICAGKKAAPDYNLATEFPAIAAEWDYRVNKKPPEDYLPFSNKTVSWQCAQCGNKWAARVIDRTKSGRGCPHCSKCSAKAP